MTTCIILHNTIAEDERDTYDYNNNECLTYDQYRFTVSPSFSREGESAEHVVRRREREIMNSYTHQRLQEDLIEHLWNIHGDE